MASDTQIRFLKDFEVLGVGGTRRAELLQEQGAKVLLTHSALVPRSQAEFYDTLLQETVAWLKPEQIRDQTITLPSEEFLIEALKEDLKINFPQTVNYLKGGLRELLLDYLAEVPWQGPLLSAHLRYFPVYLKRKFQDSRLYLISQKEWLWSYLSFADFGFPPPEQGRVILNPSLQSLYSSAEISEVGLSEGLTIFYYDFITKTQREYKMDLWDAAVADVLQEDRKYTLDQLLDQLQLLELEVGLPTEEWRKKLSYLKSLGIILVSGSGWILNPN